MRLVHRIRVERSTTTTTNLKASETRPVVATAMPCLVEELEGRERDTIIGLIPDARFRISWARGSDLREHDIVQFDGAWYRVRNAAKHTGLGSRRNQLSTAILEQDHGRHDS